MRRLAPLFILSTAGLLTACGGGGGSSTTPPAGGQSIGSNSLTGRFIDGPVSGLRYSTPTSTGRTNANGEFTYRQGETVSFFVGDVLIGQTPGATTVTPFSLAGTTPPTATLDIVKTVRLVNTRRNFSNSTATPLETAANIAVFLQTVDDDGNPANGIQIPAALDGLTAGKSIDFSQTFGQFQTDANVQSLLAAGRSAGLWAGSRTLKDPFLALDALYSGLGITPAIKRVTNRVTDNGRDSSVDITRTYSYDTQGRVSSESVTNPAGQEVSRSTFAYDENGRKLNEQHDTNGDGNPDGVTTFFYDASGVLTRSESSKSGAIDSVVNYSYDTSGRLKETQTRNASGTVISTSKYTDGILTEKQGPINNDNVLDKTTHTYDDSGHLISTTFDLGSDGSADEIVAYTYDTNDNVVTQVHTRGGQIVLSITHAYDANGNPVTSQFIHPALPASDYTYTYEYNDDGTLKTWSSTRDNDSIDSYNYEGTHTWASAGWLQ